MKKILAIVLSFVLLLSMSVPAFAAEVDTATEIMPRSETVLDSFTLAADVNGTNEYTGNYTGYSQYRFVFTELGVTGATYNLQVTTPPFNRVVVVQTSKDVEENHSFATKCYDSGNYKVKLYTQASSITGVVLLVRVYGLS